MTRAIKRSEQLGQPVEYRTLASTELPMKRGPRKPDSARI